MCGGQRNDRLQGHEVVYYLLFLLVYLPTLGSGLWCFQCSKFEVSWVRRPDKFHLVHVFFPMQNDFKAECPAKDQNPEEWAKNSNKIKTLQGPDSNLACAIVYEDDGDDGEIFHQVKAELKS